jgi:hypothetical protein
MTFCYKIEETIIFEADFMSRETEDERRKRIKRQQLARRDPGDSKIKGYDWGKHAQRTRQIAKKKQKPLLVELWQTTPARWQWLIYGFFLGTFFGLFVVVLLPPDLSFLIIVPQLVCMLCGMFLGTLIDNKKGL